MNGEWLIGRSISHARRSERSADFVLPFQGWSRFVECSQSGADNLEEVFEAKLTRIGKVVALLDRWEEPKYLTRIWTIYEQFTAAKLNVPTDT